MCTQRTQVPVDDCMYIQRTQVLVDGCTYIQRTHVPVDGCMHVPGWNCSYQYSNAFEFGGPSTACKRSPTVWPASLVTFKSTPHLSK